MQALPFITLESDGRMPELVDYTTLSLAEVKTQLVRIAGDAEAGFGNLDARQLNWRPDATRWSVAQCFAHLLTANGLMMQAADEALNGTAARTIWRRLPVLPGVFGRMMVRSQEPRSTRRFTAPPKAQPAASDIPPDVIRRFVEQHRDAIACVEKLDERDAARTIMTSPFVRLITYSVLDGWRLLTAHDRRHFEQARRVTEVVGFPRS